MEVIVERAAGLDIHKKSITACVRTPDRVGGRAEQVRTFSAFLHGLTALRQWLVSEQVTQVAMEATSSYWLPVWRVLEEDEPFQLLLCNARHIKQVPGRKTDVKDASWLCQLDKQIFVEPSQLDDGRVPHRPRLRVAAIWRNLCPLAGPHLGTEVLERCSTSATDAD